MLLIGTIIMSNIRLKSVVKKFISVIDTINIVNSALNHSTCIVTVKKLVIPKTQVMLS